MINSSKIGFLLTRQVQDINNAMQITYWVKTDDGPAKLIINDEQAIFFVESSFIEYTTSLLQSIQIEYQQKPLGLQTFAAEPVHGIYFKTLSNFYKARDALKSNGIKCYEDDIRPEDRYLMERFITGSLMFNANQMQKTSCVYANHNNVNNQASNHYYLSFTQVKSKRASYQPHLSMLSIDIECSMQGELYSIGCYSDHTKIVFMIANPHEKNSQKDNLHGDNHEYISWVTDESDLLYQFIEWFNKYDPDIIIGWNVINFDFKLLQSRCERHNIKFAIGRDHSAPYWRQNRLSPEQNFILIAGRVVLDGIDLLKTATYSFSSFSLENVAQELLGVGKKIDDVDNRGAEITRQFLHNKQALAQYNLEDCHLVWRIFKKTQLLEFAILRSSLTGLELDRIGGSVAAFTNLYLPKLHRKGYVAPNMGDGERDLISPGGYVMDSIPGLYKNVLVLDFKSLYPSIIRTFKIDPLGLIEGLNEIADQHSVSETPIEGFDGAYFSRTQHFLPDIIEQLWAERDKAKQQQNAPLSQAIKIIMNSFYGILGSTGCRFFDPRLSGSITKRSHQLLNTTKDWIETLGYKVIYGDTDSIFVSVGERKSDNECQEEGKELMRFINDRWQQELLDKYQVESKLEIEFETHFHHFLMPTVRGQEIGTKKRYAGLVGRGEDEALVFKGLESVRTDWTKLAKTFQQTLYLKVFKEEPVEDYILQMVSDTANGKFDQDLIYRKRIRRKLSEYQKNIPPHVKAARHADEQNALLGKPLRYQNKGWIEYVMTLSGPQTLQHKNSKIDHQFYIDRQLEAVADGILPFIGKSFKQVCDDQLKLF